MADGPSRPHVAALMTPPRRDQGDAPVFLGERYRVLGTLGRGGAATVYRAHDLMLGREVAVKVLAPVEPSCDEVRRHEAEMGVLSSLRHPALVTLFDAGTDPVDGGALVRAYLVMELVAGPTLARRLHDGPLDAGQTARVGWALAGALATVHARGVVHRDVKPGNVLLTGSDALDGDPDEPLESSPVKLADFGIARIAAATRLTMTGAILGTATYLSPEQATGGALGPATDVYSLGLVLLECLTGVPAFQGTVAEVAAARLSRDPEVPAGLDRQLSWLLRRMTARNPDARPSAAEVRDELESLSLRVTTEPIAVPVVLAAVRDGEPSPAELSHAAPSPAVPTPVGPADAPTQRLATVAPASLRRRDRPAAPNGRRRRVAAIGLAAALVVGVMAALTTSAWRTHGQQSASAALAQTLSAGLTGDVTAVTGALRDGRLDAAATLLGDARRELAEARDTGALPQAQLAAFAATLDGATQQLSTARADQAAAAAAVLAAQEQAAASTPVAAVAAQPPPGPQAAPPAPPARPAGGHGHGHGHGR